MRGNLPRRQAAFDPSEREEKSLNRNGWAFAANLLLLAMQNSSALKNVGSPPPFVVFFTLAAFDAIFGAGAWLPALMGVPLPPAGDLASWHGREMLFGYLSASLCGFFFTALPRWTGRPVPDRAVRAVLALWLIARLAPSSTPFAFVATLPGVALAIIATFLVAAARDVRNVKMVALLWVYAMSGVFAADSPAWAPRDFALRLAIVALAGLVMIIGGRVLPALTSRFDALCGEASEPAGKKGVEGLSMASAAAGLVFWLAQPESGATAAALFAAAAGQALRMGGWLGKRTASSPPLWAFYAAYSMIPAGFTLLGAHALAPQAVAESAGLHVLLAGGVGGMCLAVKSSMIRKRSHCAFVMSGAGAATAFLWFAAVLCRAAGAFSGAPADWLIAASLAWAAAFALFLYDFRAPLSQFWLRR